MINLFIADDHTMFREMLKDAILQDPEIVIKDEAQNGDEALEKLLKADFDVAVLDIAMPGLNGLDVLKEVVKIKPDQKILILSMYSEDQYAVKAFRAGAFGYITKSEATKELLNAIHKVASGSKYINSQVAEQLLFKITQEPEVETHLELSAREYQVMKMIALGYTVKEIASGLNLSVSSISTLRTRMLKKMKMSNNAEVTQYVLKNNLLE
ncbi:MAG: response regulator transcription factor [Calditrichia bacterium]|nr:response regulator transcription factor [Calditrichia bacterium]